MVFVCHRTVRMAAVYHLKIKYGQAKLQRTAKKCARNYNACAQLLFCSTLSLPVLVAFAFALCKVPKLSLETMLEQGPYATTTATPSKKCVSILLSNFSYVEIYLVCLSVLKLSPAEYATNAFSSKYNYEKLGVAVHAKKCTKNYNARAQLLFC